MANQAHVERLLQGAEAWNRWRRENPDAIPNLSFADLRNSNLAGADLRDANLKYTDLSYANLYQANLSGTDLSSVCLRYANLYQANLSGAYLCYAYLYGANLSDADFSGADLSHTDLSGAYLCYASFSNANLSDANLSRSTLRFAYLHETNLSGADLTDADLRRIKLISNDEINTVIGYSRVRWMNPIDEPRGRRDDHRSSESMLPSGEFIVTYLNFDSASEGNDAYELPTTFCHVHAEMDDQVIVNRVTTVEVIISKEEINRVISAAAQGGKAEIDPDKRLIVQVIPKLNFMTVDSDRLEVDPPEEGKPYCLHFDLRATHLGEGEVWVVLRQGQLSLLTLVLQPTIVENRDALRAMSIAAVQFVADASTNSPSPSHRLSATGSVEAVPPKPSEPLHQLRIVERRNGSQITYWYELSSPSLGVLSQHESKPITSDRYEYVENLYKEIESRWLSTQGDAEDFAAELRAFGGQLFDQLFPESLQQQLWQHRAQLDNIMVISTEPFIPWELVHLKPPGQNHLPNEVWFLGQMGLTRWVHDVGVGFPAEETRVRTQGTRYVIPHYPDSRYRLPQAEQESQFLEQRFGAAKVEPQSSEVRRLLESGDFDLLHFAGHGVAEQGNITNAKLLLEGRVDNGGKYVPAYLSATTVEQYCNCTSRNRNQRPMVVLNACQIGREGYSLTGIGGFAQAFLKGGVGVFVGTLWSVGDRPARIFTEALYSSLIEGKTLAEATVTARQQASQAGDATWLAYVVYGHPHLKLRFL